MMPLEDSIAIIIVFIVLAKVTTIVNYDHNTFIVPAAAECRDANGKAYAETTWVEMLVASNSLECDKNAFITQMYTLRRCIH
jgi:hypothetical protein